MDQCLLAAAGKSMNVVAWQVAKASEQLENLDVSRSVGQTAIGAPARPMTGSRVHRELRVTFCKTASIPDAIDARASAVNVRPEPGFLITKWDCKP